MTPNQAQQQTTTSQPAGMKPLTEQELRQIVGGPQGSPVL